MKKTADSLRKTPKQTRSRALVQAIFEGTVRILPKVGSRNITTKKIAEMAGVSVGSLYQYFPNKESLMGSLMDFAMRETTEEMFKNIEALSGESMEEATAAVVDFALQLFLKERQKIKEIYMQAPELGRVPSLLRLRQSVVERLAQELENHSPGHRREEYIRVSFVACNSVMGVIHTMLYDDTQNYRIDELSSELKVMLNAYFAHRKEIFS